MYAATIQVVVVMGGDASRSAPSRVKRNGGHVTGPCNMTRDFYAASRVVVLFLIGAATVLGWCWTLARWGVGS